MIEFFDDEGVVGTVEYVNGELVASRGSQNVATLWLYRGNDPTDFESAYDGWSNGYVVGRRVTDVVTASNGYISTRRIDESELNDESDTLIAAARDDKRVGAMIALVPREAEQLVLPDFEPADELHLTLFYLGDAVDITPTQINELVTQLMQDVRSAARAVPIFAKTFGVAHWNPESDYPAWVLNVGDSTRDDSSGLESLRESVEQAVNGVGITYPAQHSPWQPHICIAYSKDDLYGELASRLGPVTFDTLRVAWGEYDIDIPLVPGDVVIADAAGIEALHLTGKHNQKSHGNRKRSRDTLVSNDVTQDNAAPVVNSTDERDEFDARVLSAYTGYDVREAVPVFTNTNVQRALEDDGDESITVADVREAYESYTHTDYEGINRDLRSSDGNVDGLYSDFRDTVRTFDHVMNLSRSTHHAVLFRGIKSARTTFGDAFNADVGSNVGLQWTDTGYMSTSTTKDTALGFGGTTDGVLLRILAPSGTKMTGTPFSSTSGEDEIIINRASSNRVVADYIDPESGMRILDVEVTT